MQLSEKLLSFFPALRSGATNSQRSQVPESSRTNPANGTSFHEIHSQLSNHENKNSIGASKSLRNESSRAPGSGTTGMPKNIAKENSVTAIAKAPVTAPIKASCAAPITTPCISINVPDSFVSLNEHSSTVTSADLGGIPTEFMNELAGIVSFTTLAAAPPSAEEADVIVSIPTSELTEDSLDSLNKLLAKHGVVTTGFLRDENDASSAAGEQLPEADSTGGVSAQAIESALILGVHIPLVVNTTADAETNTADVLSNPALTDLLAMPVPNSNHNIAEQTPELMKYMELLNTPEAYSATTAASDVAASENAVQAPESPESKSKRGIQGLSASVQGASSAPSTSASTSVRVLAEQLPAEAVQPVELTVNVSAAAKALDAMTPTATVKNANNAVKKADTSANTVAASAPDQGVFATPLAVSHEGVHAAAHAAPKKGRNNESEQSSSGQQTQQQSTQETLAQESAADDAQHALKNAVPADAELRSKSDVSFNALHAASQLDKAEVASASSTHSNELAANSTQSASTPSTPTAASPLAAVAAPAEKASMRGVFDIPKTDSRVFRVVMERFVPQTSAIVSNLVEQSQNTARLILTPDSLGTIVVNLAMQEKEGTLHLEVSNSSTRALVEANMGILKEQCAAQGVNFGQVTVSVREQEASFGRFEQSGQQARQQRREDQESRTAFARGSHSETSGRSSKDERSEPHSRRRGGGRQATSGDSKFERYA
ncbi:MAG: flagellar hook-length control protein FliK [Candidatus Kapaibacterium sp.]|jgi:flagellar hook-length control protein FliK